MCLNCQPALRRALVPWRVISCAFLRGFKLMNNTLLLPRPGLSTEILARLVVAAALAIFVWRAFTAYWAEPNAGLLIFFLTEVFTFGLVIFARLPKQSNRSAYAWFLVAV